MSVAGVVVSHGHADELERLLPVLRPQLAELVVIENIHGSVGDVADDVRVLRNELPLSFAANVNQGIAATTAPFVLVANPDAVPEPDAVRILREFLERRPRAGIAGPQMRYPDGRWQPSRRRFPTVAGTLVRRTPLRFLAPPLERQRRHYLLDEQPTEPAPADWLLAAFLLMRREMLLQLGGLDAGFRLYGEDIDLCYRAAKAGWGRWYVPAAVVTHEYAAVVDRTFVSRHTLWHARAMVRFVRKHPERLLRLV